MSKHREVAMAQLRCLISTFVLTARSAKTASEMYALPWAARSDRFDQAKQPTSHLSRRTPTASSASIRRACPMTASTATGSSRVARQSRTLTRCSARRSGVANNICQTIRCFSNPKVPFRKAAQGAAFGRRLIAMRFLNGLAA
jgi:hypothetical protein